MALSCHSGLLDSMMGLNSSQHLGLLTRRLYHCLADHRLIQVDCLTSAQQISLLLGCSGWRIFGLWDPSLVCLQLRGSMLALALVTLELETCCPDWLALTIDLLRKAQVPDRPWSSGCSLWPMRRFNCFMWIVTKVNNEPFYAECTSLYHIV